MRYAQNKMSVGAIIDAAKDACRRRIRGMGRKMVSMQRRDAKAMLRCHKDGTTRAATPMSTMNVVERSKIPADSSVKHTYAVQEDEPRQSPFR